MKTIVVTGSTGLIGKNIINKLSNEYNICAITRKEIESGDDVHNIQYKPLDLSGEWDIATLPKRSDIVIHLAQSEHFRDFPDKAYSIYKTNVESTIKLLEYARKSGAKKFILASSGGVYGDNEGRLKEDLVVPASGNLGFYLSTKLCMEILSQNYNDYFDLQILRFFFVYGPGQRKTMLIPRILCNIKNRTPINLNGETGIKINPTFVDDAVNAIYKSIEINGMNIINVGGPDILSIKEIANIIGEETGVAPIFETNNDTHANDIIADITKMKEILVSPEVKFRSGIKKLLS